jgi:hypothetical protein
MGTIILFSCLFGSLIGSVNVRFIALVCNNNEEIDSYYRQVSDFVPHYGICKSLQARYERWLRRFHMVWRRGVAAFFFSAIPREIILAKVI